MPAFAPRNRGNLLVNYIQTGSRGLDIFHPDTTRDLEQNLTRLPQLNLDVHGERGKLGSVFLHPRHLHVMDCSAFSLEPWP